MKKRPRGDAPWPFFFNYFGYFFKNSRKARVVA